MHCIVAVMKPGIFIAAWFSLSFFAETPLQAQDDHSVSAKPEILSLVDPVRHRSVPVAIYQDASQHPGK
jgi:hypothetical protein